MIILDSGRVIDPAQKIDGTRTVLIDGERIAAVREQAATPAEKLVHQVIDCRGKWILPGLVDLTCICASRARKERKRSPPGPERRPREA